MGAAENTQRIREAFEQLANGNGRPLVESLADDVRWTVIGTTRWSGTYHGKQAVLDELLAPLRARLSGPLKVRAERIVAEADLVVVEGRGRGTTQGGDAYDNTYCWVYRIADGLIREVTEYGDTALVEAVLGERTVPAPSGTR
jgi:uncharacterized protein